MRTLYLTLRLLTAALAMPTSPSVAAPSPKPAHTYPTIGPFSLGMTVDAAMRAAPGVPWEKTVSKLTGRTLAISGPGAWTLGDMSYTVRLRPLAYGWADMELNGYRKGGDVESCRANVLELATLLEAQFPAMGQSKFPFVMMPPPPRPAGSVIAQRTPEGHVVVTGQPDYSTASPQPESRMLTPGKAVQVRENVYPNGRANWEFEQAPSDENRNGVRVFAVFQKDMADMEDPAFGKDGPGCTIGVNLKARPAGRPAADTLDLARIRPVAAPSKEILHTSIDGMILPPAGVALTYRCEVNRQTGTLKLCRTKEGIDPPQAQGDAADMRLMSFRFDPMKLDPDSDVPLQTEMNVILSPSDRDPKLTAAAGPIPVWAKVASPSTLSQEYPAEAIRKEQEALVTATCRIEEDLRVTCSTIETDPPGLHVFDEPARRVLSHYRAHPLLRNGTPAAGSEVKIRVRFMLAD